MITLTIKDTQEKHIKKLWHIRYDILFNFASASLDIVSFTGLNFLLNQSTESKDEQKNELKKVPLILRMISHRKIFIIFL